ncbi:LacI family DNA-binding transcriptional regulator [Corynebacterium lowii]|uniref:Catabolite control protein A n=1 Tax=Corynebacterium lowii TaxID=1544413 RepID=A0A0Q0UEE2_9CORY|nr:LacI family DNA-binding transcriptional regulator [Corynebacterium lowii]KQB86227.1 Catabolite control protein A [Corynebacterium lowii]MDP9852701.1 DNA-binding LacI/PurR family transcriptional regulator [Corynebacterium lowii]
MPRRNTSKATLASIAAELGVSRTTVSNAYNHPEQLSPKLRAKILAVARAKGYSGPDPTARSLRSGHAGAIGVVLTEDLTYAFDDQPSVDFLAGVAEACADSETSLTLIPVGAHAPRRTSLVAGASVDGFVVYSVAEDDPDLRAVLARGLPTVICGQPTTIEDVPFVGIDDRRAIRPAAQALVEAGHRHVGILAIRLHRDPVDGFIDQADLDRASLHIQRDRVLGALDVFAEAGLDTAAIPVVTRHINDAPRAYQAAQQLLETHPELTAVLCTTDSMAHGVLAYAADHGLRVPEDLSVTGFDGVAAALERGLTTVIQPNRMKGVAAGTALLEQVSTEASWEHTAGEPQRTILSTEFYPGRTVAPPRH